KLVKKGPEQIGMELGSALTTETDFVESYNVVKGFVNVKISDAHFMTNFASLTKSVDEVEPKDETVMVEYSSPNTNKPLHLGHIRNNLLGYSVAQILKADGYNVRSEERRVGREW